MDNTQDQWGIRGLPPNTVGLTKIVETTEIIGPEIIENNRTIEIQ
jgi:hypothetical protein